MMNYVPWPLLCPSVVLFLVLILASKHREKWYGWLAVLRTICRGRRDIYRTLQYRTCLEYHSSPQIRNRVHWIGGWHHQVGWLALTAHAQRPPTLISSRLVQFSPVHQRTRHKHSIAAGVQQYIMYVHVACHGITGRGLGWLVS